jgi:hypothetical protein
MIAIAKSYGVKAAGHLKTVHSIHFWPEGAKLPSEKDTRQYAL